MSQLSCGLGRGGKTAAPVTLIAVSRQAKSGVSCRVKVPVGEGLAIRSVSSLAPVAES